MRVHVHNGAQNTRIGRDEGLYAVRQRLHEESRLSYDGVTTSCMQWGEELSANCVELVSPDLRYAAENEPSGDDAPLTRFRFHEYHGSTVGGRDVYGMRLPRWDRGHRVLEPRFVFARTYEVHA